MAVRRSFANICDIEVTRQGEAFVAKVRFEAERTAREFRSVHMEGILEQLAVSLPDRYEEIYVWGQLENEEIEQ